MWSRLAGSWPSIRARPGWWNAAPIILLTDSFTADRFNNPYTCQTMQVECDFFRQLASGRSEHYRLLADFNYSPPWFLPRVQVDFVNPEIRLYERIK